MGKMKAGQKGNSFRKWLLRLLKRWLYRRQRNIGSEITLDDLIFYDMMDDD